MGRVRVWFNDELRFCPVCEGIMLHWNKQTQEWQGRYVEGGAYCSCSDEELALLEEGNPI